MREWEPDVTGKDGTRRDVPRTRGREGNFCEPFQRGHSQKFTTRPEFRPCWMAEEEL